MMVNSNARSMPDFAEGFHSRIGSLAGSIGSPARPSSLILVWCWVILRAMEGSCRRPAMARNASFMPGSFQSLSPSNSCSTHRFAPTSLNASVRRPPLVKTRSFKFCGVQRLVARIERQVLAQGGQRQYAVKDVRVLGGIIGQCCTAGSCPNLLCARAAHSSAPAPTQPDMSGTVGSVSKWRSARLVFPIRQVARPAVAVCASVVFCGVERPRRGCGGQAIVPHQRWRWPQFM